MDAYKNNSKHISDTENDEDSLIYKNIKNALYRDKEKAMKRYNKIGRAHVWTPVTA